MKISADNPFANPKPAVNKVKRLGWTLVIAVLVHVALIFSVNFNVSDLPEASTSLDVTLVTFASEKADVQESVPETQQATANTEKTPPKKPIDSATPAPAPVAKPEVKPEPAAAKPAPVEPTVTAKVTPPAAPVVVSKPAPAKPKPQPKPEPKPEPKPQPKPQPKPTPKAPAQPQTVRKPVTFSRDQLSSSLAGIEAEQTFTRQQPNQGPRISRHHLATSKRDISAWYRDAWRKKVERIGNLNYPEEARRQGIYGSLRVSVLINKDGSLQNMRVLQSSGHKVLDQAALNIVRLSAPFTPFSGDLAAKYDQLEIIRTWRFEHGDRLSSQ